MAAAETPPTRSPSDRSMTKIGVGLVVLLAVVALIVTVSSGTKSSAPMLLGASTPMRVTVPSINASSTLIALGTKKDGSLAVPPLSNPSQASWYDKSPTPGEPGPSVILGHVNGNGKPGIFLDLAQVAPGQPIIVDRLDGLTAVFTVSHVDTVPKDAFPSDQVYGNTLDSEIRLITCEAISTAPRTAIYQT